VIKEESKRRSIPSQDLRPRNRPQQKKAVVVKKVVVAKTVPKKAATAKKPVTAKKKTAKKL
jgi:hypothetical protein